MRYKTPIIFLALLTILFIIPCTAQGKDVSGPITVDTTWTVADSPIRVVGTVTVNSGGTLTIASGVTVQFTYGNTIIVNGTLNASSGVTFNYISGFSTSILSVESGGHMYLTDCTFTGWGYNVTYTANSEGTISGCSTLDVLSVYSASVIVSNSSITTLYLRNSAMVTGCTIGSLTVSGGDPTITNNRLTGTSPIAITDPDLILTKISGNTYTASDPYISIYGTLDGSRTLNPLDGISKYQLSNDLTVASTATLTIASGVTVQFTYGNTIIVNGTLNASSGVTFNYISGFSTSILSVESGGHMYLTDCTFTGWGYNVTYKTGSSGTVNHCTISNL